MIPQPHIHTQNTTVCELSTGLYLPKKRKKRKKRHSNLRPPCEKSIPGTPAQATYSVCVLLLLKQHSNVDELGQTESTKTEYSSECIVYTTVRSASKQIANYVLLVR